MRSTTRGTADSPRLTVLAAALDEVNNVADFIHSFVQLEYPNKELVLCAGGSDGTYEKAWTLRSDSVQVIPQQVGEGKQAALRKALRSASGDVIVLTDADSALSTDAVTKLIGPILSGDETVTTGIFRPRARQLSNPFVIYQHALELVGLRRIERTRYTSSLQGRNCAVLRSVLDEVGGFGEDIYIGTDSFLSKKLIRGGHRIRFVPESVVETDYETNLWDYCRQQSRWTRSGIVNRFRFRFYRDFVRALVPSMFGLGLLGLPLAGIWFGRSVLYLWGLLIAFIYVRHVRYIASFLQSQQRPLSAPMLARVAVYMWAAWAAHLLALVQLPIARLRRSW